MRALDTDILVRLLLHDDPAQTPRAIAVCSEPGFVSLTVLLECFWVLRSYGALGITATAEALRLLLALEHLEIEAAPRVAWAIDRFEAGADFPDLLHLIAAMSNASVDRFATFDRRLQRGAGPDVPLPIETLA